MSEFLDKLSSDQLLAALAIAAGAVVALVFILSVLWYQVRYLADWTALERDRQQTDAAVKQDLLRRGLSPQELRVTLEALTIPVGGSGGLGGGAGDQRAQVLKNLVACGEGVPAAVVEEVAGMVATADRASLATVAVLLQGFVDEELSGEPVFAAVRAVCRAPRTAAAAAPVPRREIELEVTHAGGGA